MSKDVISVDNTGGASSYKELVEKLAAIEHARWSDWMEYMLVECGIRSGDDNIGIRTCGWPTVQFNHWFRQMETDYEYLSEKEKDSDREQVQRYLPLLHSLLISKLPEANPREWADNKTQVAWTIGYEKAISDVKAVLDELFGVDNER